MMKNIFIYPNLRKDSARDILQPVCDQLRRDGGAAYAAQADAGRAAHH